MVCSCSINHHQVDLVRVPQWLYLYCYIDFVFLSQARDEVLAGAAAAQRNCWKSRESIQKFYGQGSVILPAPSKSPVFRERAEKEEEKVSCQAVPTRSNATPKWSGGHGAAKTCKHLSN